MNPVMRHVDELEATKQQLLVFARELNQLYQVERCRTAALEEAYRDMVGTLALVVEAKDPSTRAHLQRAHDYAVALSEVVAPELAADQSLRIGFLLHDVGKVGVPEAVLAKPGPLDEGEWEVMRQHPVIGERILRAIPGMGRVAKIVRHEHERWDGGGYPDGIAGAEIPLGSRIILACDSYHAMTSTRPYRDAMPHVDAVSELTRNAGTQFDPEVGQALVGYLYGRRQSGLAAI